MFQHFGDMSAPPPFFMSWGWLEYVCHSSISKSTGEKCPKVVEKSLEMCHGSRKLLHVKWQKSYVPLLLELIEFEIMAMVSMEVRIPHTELQEFMEEKNNNFSYKDM